jgi:hypothetical protein
MGSAWKGDCGASCAKAGSARPATIVVVRSSFFTEILL